MFNNKSEITLLKVFINIQFLNVSISRIKLTSFVSSKSVYYNFSGI
jgi:hypothetical protein